MESAEATPTPAPQAHESVGGVASALWRKKGWIIVPTALAFVASMLRLSGEPGGAALRKAQDAMARVGLAEAMPRPVGLQHWAWGSGPSSCWRTVA